MRIKCIVFTVVTTLLAQACNPEGSEPAAEAQDLADLPTSTATGELLVECQAQRAVHIVAGLGSFAWFSQLWPLPVVINNFQPGWAYDNPANAAAITTEPGHPLFARKLGPRALWEGRGKDPHPSVFVAGMNEAHTPVPSSIAVHRGTPLAAAGVSLQSSLQPVVPAVVFFPAGPATYMESYKVADVDAAIALLRTRITPEQERLLRPSAAQLTRYLPLNASAVELRFATQLAFTANAFGMGLIATAVIPGHLDDPHGAFLNGIGPFTARVNRLATTLDAFYADLSLFREPLCGDSNGALLSMANNTVMTIVGDTPKSFLSTLGWPDATLGSANWMYLRSNGFTRPGWFGQVTNLNPQRTNFNPTTGDLDSTATPAADATAAFGAALYAIARGDGDQFWVDGPYSGVIK